MIEPAAIPPSPYSPPPPSGPGGGAWGGLRAAIMLLSRIPTGRSPSSLAARRWASGWFPLVGALIGGLCAATQLVTAPWLGARLAAVVAVALAVLVTGALHEDGLADTADALGGARDRAQIFVILKDSRHGTYGVLALVLAVLLRIGCLEALGPRAAAGLVLAAIVSRVAIVYLLAALPYVTPSEVSRSGDVAHAGPAQLALATALGSLGCGALVALGVLPLLSLTAVVGAAAAVSVAAGWRFHVRAGGITGDFLGAGQQLAEISALVALVALHH